MPWDDPDFAYNYVRPVAVVSGCLIGFWLVRDWRAKREERKRERQEAARDVTPR